MKCLVNWMPICGRITVCEIPNPTLKFGCSCGDVCVLEWARERENEEKSGRERKRKRNRARSRV